MCDINGSNDTTMFKTAKQKKNLSNYTEGLLFPGSEIQKLVEYEIYVCVCVTFGDKFQTKHQLSGDGLSDWRQKPCPK